MSTNIPLLARLRLGHTTSGMKMLGEAADAIEELQDAFREIYEVYAGSDGFIPETCAEGYQQQLIKEMVEIAAKYMRIRYGE